MTAIVPIHLTFTLSQIVLKTALICISIAPRKSTFSILFVLCKTPLISVSFFVLPATFALSQTFTKFTFVYRAIFPFILTIAMRMSSMVRSFIWITIIEVLQTLAFFDEPAEMTWISSILYPDNGLCLWCRYRSHVPYWHATPLYIFHPNCSSIIRCLASCHYQSHPHNTPTQIWATLIHAFCCSENHQNKSSH